MAAWLLALLRPEPGRRAVVVPPDRQHRHGLDPYLAAALDGEARDVACAPAGQRNQRLTLAARRIGRPLDAGLAQHVVVTGS